MIENALVVTFEAASEASMSKLVVVSSSTAVAVPEIVQVSLSLLVKLKPGGNESPGCSLNKTGPADSSSVADTVILIPDLSSSSNVPKVPADVTKAGAAFILI